MPYFNNIHGECWVEYCGYPNDYTPTPDTCLSDCYEELQCINKTAGPRQMCQAFCSGRCSSPSPETCNGAVYCPGESVSFAGVLNLLGHVSIKDPNGVEIVNSWFLGSSSSFPACQSGAGTYTYTQNLVWPGCYVCNESCPTPTQTPTTTPTQNQNATPTPTPAHTPIPAPTTGNQTNVPVADFTCTPLTGTAPLTVQFTDTSTHAPFAWLWDFGDNATSEEQDPVHTYESAGTYDVSLMVANADGSNTTMRADYMTVTAPQTTFYVYAEGSGFYPPGYDSLPEGNTTPRDFYNYLDGRSGAVNVDPRIQWIGRGLYRDNASDESHWNSSEQASSYADNADFSVFAGHGGNGHIIFGTSDRDVDLYSNYMKFGSNRAKWVTFFSCNTLNESTQTAWESVFDGVHIINGFDTEGLLYESQGTKYAEMLTGIGGGILENLSVPHGD